MGHNSSSNRGGSTSPTTSESLRTCLVLPENRSAQPEYRSTSFCAADTRIVEGVGEEKMVMHMSEAGEADTVCRIGRVDNNGKAEDSTAREANHLRSIDLLGVIMQVDTFLAGLLLFNLTGQAEGDNISDAEKVQVVLQVVTFGFFLSAIVHTALLMVCTGQTYTLSWYDPILPGITSAIALVLLVITVADAALLELRPSWDITSVSYWLLIGLGLVAPLILAAVVVTMQLVYWRSMEDIQAAAERKRRKRTSWRVGDSSTS